MEWYYSVDGERIGPISEDEFKAAAASDTIGADTLVWNETMAEWQAYSSIYVIGDKTEPAATSEEPVIPSAAEGDIPLTAAPNEGTVVCRECGAVQSADTMAPYGEQWVCSGCKDVFFQKLREGVNVDAGALLPGTGGLTENADLMAAARDALTDKWGLAVGTLFIFGLLNLVVGGVFQGVATGIGTISGLPQYAIVIIATVLSWGGVVVQGPLAVGVAKFSLNVSDDKTPELGDLFYGFTKFGPSFSAVLVQTIVLQLLYLPGQVLMQATGAMGNQAIFAGVGLMVLAIPAGIFLSLSWWFTTFAIADNDNIGGLDALKYSWNLMNGNRVKLFLMFCRFIGWFLLCCLTCFIGFLWLNPYVQVSTAFFYRDAHDPE